MFCSQLLNLIFFVLLQFAFSSSQYGVPLQQVPVCVPLAGSNMQGCPTVTHHFPRRNQISDYVQYRNFVPSMKEATICAWIEADYNDIPILGYASPETAANDLTIFLHKNPKRIRLFVRNKYYDFIVPSTLLMSKYHLCLTFSSKRNQRSIYINGNEVESVSHSTSSSARGGKLVLGQDHDDKYGGRFDPNQSFWGNMTNFMIWPRVLTRHEVSKIAHNCDCPSDFAIAMTLDRVEHFGEAYYSIPDVCPTV